MKRKHVKFAVGLTSQVSVGFVVTNIIKATMPIGASPINRVACLIGSVVISGMLNKPVQNYTDEMVDSMADAFKTGADAAKNDVPFKEAVKVVVL